jgi:NAD(P) transhydrogenase
MYSFDMVVIGSGPGGQKAAIAASKLGKRVALVERSSQLGGVCVNTGTLPSKTLREAVTYFTGLTLREIYGQSHEGGCEHRRPPQARRLRRPSGERRHS